MVIYLPVWQSICLATYLSGYLVSQSSCPFIYLAINLSSYLSIYLSIYVYLAICLSVNVSV
jgi:hypothetical protein